MKKENGERIKEWCIETIGEPGWIVIITRAYPEILLCKRKISVMHITPRTTMDKEHVNIINKYLLEVYGLVIPAKVSNYEANQKAKKGLKVEWMDKVTGNLKLSFTVKKPKWFIGLLSGKRR